MTSKYATQTTIANNKEMRDRIAACYVEYETAGYAIPDQDWDKTAIETRREWAGTNTWSAMWDTWTDPDDGTLIGNSAIDDSAIQTYVRNTYPIPEPPAE